ncbi:MAG: DNA-formamidopyrimidine glycosylase [Bacteroidota bacterium]
MPELPEVETIRLTLLQKLVGTKIRSGEVLHEKMVLGTTAAELLNLVSGKTITGLERRGKYLLLELSEGLVIGIHLRMTGRLSVEKADFPVAKATYFRLLLDNGTELRFNDQRKFGKVFLFEQGNPPQSLLKIGPEPLSPQFTASVLKKRFGHRSLAVKKALLNQEIIAGIGNIYADEALFVSGIHPARPVNSLTEAEIDALFQGIQQVLREGIQYRGTTFRDYRDGEGRLGSYQTKLRVYGQKGKPCPVCGGLIVKMNFGGRGTHFCPLCQK